MGRYYSNALLNIAAVSSPDGNGGCFMDRGLLPLTPCPVSIICADKTGSNTQTNCFILPRSEATWIVDPARKYYGGSTDRPPLWQRAWVLQERLLSPRTIQFSSLQMSWRCRIKEASESDPEMREIRNRAHMERSLWETLFGLKKFDAKFKTRVPSSDATDFQIEFGTQKELYSLYDAWYELVTTYSSCFLTKPSDVFPAISGIVQMIALSINDRYLSGLWIQDLHRGLLWSVPHHSISRQDLREIRAPSWSWAALNSSCDFFSSHFLRDVFVTKMNVLVIEGFGERTSGIDTFGGFGPVEEVVLSVIGLLKKAYPSDLESDIAHPRIEKGSPILLEKFEGKAIGHYFPENIDRRYLTQIWG